MDMKPVALLGDASDPAGFTFPTWFAAAGNPVRYYAAASTFAGQVYEYDAKGRFVRAIGRAGEGPGEFSPGEMRLYAGAGDSIHVIGQRGRYTVIAPNGSIARSVQLAGKVHGFVVDRDGFVFTGSPKAADGTYYAFQVFRRTGEPAGAYEQLDKTRLDMSRRVVALDASQQRWSVDAEQLDIKKWTRDGSIAKHFKARRDYLINGPIPMRLDITREKPPGQIMGLSFGPDGYLYVFNMVADANWKASNGKLVIEKAWDTLVEIIDPATGSLIARSRFDRITLPLGNGRAYNMVEDADGELHAQIYTFSLKRR